MRQVKNVITLMAFYIGLLLFPVPSYAETNGQIQVDGKLAIQESETFRIPITNTPIELAGPEQEKTFYYEIGSDPSIEGNQFVLSMKHSELLIAPSSLTIYVDDEPIMTKPIDGEQSTDKIIVPLKGKALEEGFHSVKISFYGVIKEGVCVAQETSGNWISLGIESYFQLSGQQQENQQGLSDYPSRFTGTEKRPVVIILPDRAAMSTLDSGMKVAAYLADQTDNENAVRFVRESEVQKITGDVIFIGAQAEFQTPFMKDIIQKAAFPDTQDALILSRYVLVDGEQRAEALFVTGNSPEVIEERIAVLITDSLMKQLSGQQMAIKAIPEVNQDKMQQTVPLKKLGMPNITLNSFETGSEPFFYYAPAAIQPDGKTILELHLKRSETIARFEEVDNAESLIDSDVELTVFVNEIPHSVDMRALTEVENDVYTVRIPIDAKQMNENRLISLQFKSSGLRKKNPCIATDQNRWIYIADDSFFTFPEGSDTDTYTLAKFPTPFIDESNEALVVLPNDESIDDQQLLSLYRSMRVVGLVPQWKLALAGDLSEADIKNQHLIFIGGPSNQPLLQDKKSDLTVTYDKDAPDLVSFGFLQEATEFVSWIQPSLWNDKKAMIVFDHVNQSKSYLDKEMLDFLKGTDELATVAVKMNNKQIYTNALQLETNSAKEIENQSVNKGSVFSMWWIVGFVGLISFTIIVIFFVIRKQKRTVR